MRKQAFFIALAFLASALVCTAGRSVAAESTGQQDKPVPYLPPQGLRGPGEVTELTRENQHLVREQLRGHQQPVFELAYSSQDPRSKVMEAWLTQAAKDNLNVTFIKLDTTKITVRTPTPTVTLTIPTPQLSVTNTGYLTEGELESFLEDWLPIWTPPQPAPKRK